MRLPLLAALLILLAPWAAAQVDAALPPPPDKNALAAELKVVSGADDPLTRLRADAVSVPAARFLLDAGTRDFAAQDPALRALLGADSDSYRTWRTLFDASSSASGVPNEPTPHTPIGQAALAKAQGTADALTGGGDGSGFSGDASGGVVCGTGPRKGCGPFAAAKVDYASPKFNGEFVATSGRGVTRTDGYLSYAVGLSKWGGNAQLVAGNANNRYTGLDDAYAGGGYGLDLGDKKSKLGEFQPGVFLTAERDVTADKSSREADMFAALSLDGDYDRDWKHAQVHETVELATQATQISAGDAWSEVQSEFGFQLPADVALRVADDFTDYPSPPDGYAPKTQVVSFGAAIPPGEVATKLVRMLRSAFGPQNQ